MATMEELADKVAHATTGKDVRGAIAEGFGQFDQVKGEVFRRVKTVEDDNAALNQRVDKLRADLSAEAQTREEADKELDDKITAEAKTRAETDKELDGKITTEAQTREEADKGLEQRIARLERYIFDGQPAYVDDDLPPQSSNGSTEITDYPVPNDVSPSGDEALITDTPKQTGSVIMVTGKETN